jgi:hypothetical protein
MFDQCKYRWVFVFFLTNILTMTPVFSKQSDRFRKKEGQNNSIINPNLFKTKDFVWDITDPVQDVLQKKMQEAIAKLRGKQTKTVPFQWLECPVKGYLASCGKSVYYLDGQKAVEIPVKKGESYEKIAEKIYCACGASAEKTVFGMLNKKVNPDGAILGLISKIFDNNSMKKIEEADTNKEESKKEAGNSNKVSKSIVYSNQKRQRFLPKITLSKIEKNTLDIDGAEIECFTCTKKVVRGATKKRLIRKNQESVFGFIFKNKKDKWIYYMELFGGKKGHLITEDGWKTKYGAFIKKHDNDASLQEKTTLRIKGDGDNTDSNTKQNQTNLSDHFIQHPMASDQDQSWDENLFKTARFNDV